MARKAPLTIRTLQPVLDAIDHEVENRAQGSNERFAKLFAQVEEHAPVLDVIWHAGWRTHFRNLCTAVRKDFRDKARLHLARLRKVAQLMANDEPFQKGDRVWVERYEHGWNVGAGKIVDRHRSERGLYSYSVLMDEGGTIPVRRTSDLRKHY